MREFKFFQDNEEEDDESVGASWMWRRIPLRTPCEVVTEEHYGIRSFLSQFPSHEIINVHAIVGPDGFIHNRENNGIGWGFDILNDLIKVTWIRFI
jgi:hypothetical protein